MKKFARVASGILALTILAGSLYGITHRRQILDYLALRNYTPSQRVSALADETTMKDSMRHVFYVNRPILSDKGHFRQSCPSTEQSIVLGCYIQSDGIFLLDVTDERLSGVIQVTAAHEALHAQYDRLSPSERKRVDGLTAAFYSSITDERVKKTVELYRAKDPSVVPNELHSILATEVRNLSPELETYYSQYFKNRGQIVTYSEKYEQTFVGLTNQVDQYDAQLKDMKVTIESNQVQIQGQSSEVERRKALLDSLINSGKTEEYNAAVPGYNAEVNSYNGLINSTKSLIAEYNSVVEKRNAIATTEKELVEAINSNALPKQTQ
jgi:hypothetical protein